MKKFSRILCLVVCGFTILLGWLSIFQLQSSEISKDDVRAQSLGHLEDKEYIMAVELLEQDLGLEPEDMLEFEELLKEAYLGLSQDSSYLGKYEEILEIQMSRETASVEIFREAFDYYFAQNEITDSLEILKTGYNTTHDESLKELYEANKYLFRYQFDKYTDISPVLNGAVIVERNGKFGLNTYEGRSVISCIYDDMSTYSDGVVVVSRDNEVFTVNDQNQRIVLLKREIENFGNLNEDRISLKTEEGYLEGNSSLGIKNVVYEDVATYNDGYAAFKQDGKWGIKSSSDEILVGAIYDEIILDELGISYNQNCYFAKIGEDVFLFSDGQQIGESFDDAKAFNERGFAAVYKNGKWGFVDINGEIMIDYIFDDALSFYDNLAAVKVDGKWGYIDITGKIVIEPIFNDANNFYYGTASVLTEEGYVFITLYENVRGVNIDG